MNKTKGSTKVLVADTKESFIQAVEKALAQGYLPIEEYSVKDNYYIGKFSIDPDSESSISKEMAMKAIEQPMINVMRSSAKNTPAKTTRKRKV